MGVISIFILGIGLVWNSGNGVLTAYIDALISDSSKAAIPLLLWTCAWNGCITTAYTMWAQTFGQQAMSPTKANLIYSSQPVWSVIFALFILHETVDLHNSIGCFALLASVYVSQAKWRVSDVGT